jgi:YggT family protein
MISVFATVLYIGLYLFFLALWVRFIFDWVQVLSRNFRPRGPLLLVAETAYTITDKPLTSVRRVIPAFALWRCRHRLGVECADDRNPGAVIGRRRFSVGDTPNKYSGARVVGAERREGFIDTL